MPLQIDTIDIDEEIDRLGEEMDDVATEQAEFIAGHGWEHSRVRQLLERGDQLDKHRSGLRWLREEYDVETVTLSGLTAGETFLVQDLKEDGFAYQAAFVAIGTRDAPWLEHNPDSPAVDRDALGETVVNVADLAPSVVKWAEERVSDLSNPGTDEGNSYMDSLLASLADETPPDESG